jgi:hypothetical protein
MGWKKSGSDHISESLETIFGLKILQLFDADLYPGSFGSWMEKFGSEIRDKRPLSAAKSVR